MAEIWKGKPVADALNEQIIQEVAALSERGVTPVLGLLRVGEREDDLAYERGILKRCETCGVRAKQVVLDAHVTQEAFDEAFAALNDDAGVHGLLVFSPLPAPLRDDICKQTMHPEKDVDGCTAGSQAFVYTGSGSGFAPCTAEGVLEMLKFYGTEIAGKRVAVIGRSLVIGRPVAMMLMREHATVTICHTKTKDIAQIAREADIIVAAAGRAGFVTKEFVREGQIVIDVGINPDEATGGITGDVCFAGAEPVVHAITPVPGGAGNVTTAVLLKHVVEAAKRLCGG